LDSNSLIRSKREHYAFDFFPGFWDALLRAFHQQRLVSIMPVRKELLRGKDALASWAKDEVPEGFFESVDEPEVHLAYAEVVQTIEDSEQYSTAAKHKFAGGADPWLVAFAHTKKRVLVTYEVAAPESKVMVKLPDAARLFNVSCVPPYVMLRQLKVKLTLR
jgi:hypothetical protein